LFQEALWSEWQTREANGSSPELSKSNPFASRTVNRQNSIQTAIDTKMQSKNLKLFPISPELGENYNQYQKEFRELFR